MSEIELKACPFCGAKPVIRERSGDERNGYNTSLELDCKCGASIGTETKNNGGLPTETVAAAKRRLRSAWNTRAPQWRPISSAPKDGRWIMLRKPGHNEVLLAYWDRLRGAWWGQGGGDGQWKKWQDATSWQPLPAPPEVEG